MDTQEIEERRARLERDEFRGMRVWLMAYAFCATAAIVAAIAAVPLLYHLVEFRIETLIAEVDAFYSMQPPPGTPIPVVRVPLLAGLEALFVGVAAIPGAIALWLGLLAVLRILVHEGPADGLRLGKTLGCILVLVPLAIPASLFGGLDGGVGLVLYCIPALICLSLAFVGLRRLALQFERHDQPRSFKASGGLLKRVGVTLFAGAIVAALPVLIGIVLELEGGLAFTVACGYGGFLAAFVVVSIGWRAPLRAWRRRNGWAAAAAIACGLAVIGTVAWTAGLWFTGSVFAFTDFNSSAGSQVTGLLMLFYLPLFLQPFLLLLLPRLLRLSAEYARWRREREAARAGLGGAG